MPETKREEKEGRLPYERNIAQIMDKCNYFLQNGRMTKAYLTLRNLFDSLIKRHREYWLEQINEDFNKHDGYVSKRKARKMLNPSRPFDHFLEERNHKRWMGVKRAFVDMATAHGLFFETREIEERDLR